LVETLNKLGVMQIVVNMSCTLPWL
jgi:hypothetical protein